MKPRVFIASSTESLNVAYSVQENLERDANVTVWPQGIFKPSNTTMSDLYEALNNTDYGIFIFTPNDVAKIRDDEFFVTRDNVIFELGLFVGKLSISKNFIVVPRNIKQFHLPSDLLGINPVTYDDSRHNLTAALGPACNKIRKAIKNLNYNKVGKRKLCQAAAFCYRYNENDDIEILLVKTSSGRWIFPKGTHINGNDAYKTAEQVAHNEGGVSGKITNTAFATFRHLKFDRMEHEIIVEVFALKVNRIYKCLEAFRSPSWFSPDDAKSALFEGRAFLYAQELEIVIQKAEETICSK